MYEKIAGLNNLTRSSWSVVSVIALCLITTSLVSACDNGPQPAATPMSTSALTPTITHAPTPTSSPALASTLGAAIGPTVPTLSGELRSTKNAPRHHPNTRSWRT